MKEYKYLGWFAGKLANWNVHIDKKISQARSALGWLTSEGISLRNKEAEIIKMLYHSSVRSVLQYGMESLTTAQHKEKGWKPFRHTLPRD